MKIIIFSWSKLSKPRTILEVGNGYDPLAFSNGFTYSHNAFDEELDELTYSWAEPLGDNFSYNPNNPSATALIFSAPYSVESPIPGNPTMDNETGEITYLSNTAGVFVTCVKVEARKCGQLVAEIYREVQVVLKDCSKNLY